MIPHTYPYFLLLPYEVLDFFIKPHLTEKTISRTTLNYSGDILVVCPYGGNKLQNRKIFFLTNLNSITCQACTSRVKVKNKGTNSGIGAVGGGLTGGIGALLLISWLFTKNPLYLGLLIPLLIVGVTIAIILVDRYIEVELDRSPTTRNQQVHPSQFA
jgi:hypothetical protein